MSESFHRKFSILFALGIVFFLASQTDAACTRMRFYDREDGSGDETYVRVIQGTCYRWAAGDAWNNKAKSLRMTHNLGCIKVWSSSDCTGQGQCVCQSNHRMLTSWNKETVGTTGKLTFSYCDTPAPKVGATVQVFEGSSFTSTSLTVEIHEGQCETFRNDEDWKSKVSSLRVTKGCVEYFNGPGCTGDEGTLWKDDSEFGESVAGEIESLDSRFNKRVRSFRSCSIPVVPVTTQVYGSIF